MGGKNLQRALFLALLAALLFPVAARACNVPVFRYALERWDSDPYQVCVFHKGPLAPADRKLLDALAKYADGDPALANFTLEVIDLDNKPDPALAKLCEEHADRGLPLLLVRYPAVARIKENVWAGRLSPEAAQALVVSPARREVVKRIGSGDSAVWILLECGDRAKDEAAGKLLDAELARLQKTLELPELTADPEDKLTGKGPLRLAFSTVRVRRDDPAEKLLVAMLLNLEEDLLERKEPMAFAVFGRGRALPPTVGAGITAENLEVDARFLTGPCTCKVKEQNPGVHLLVLADWESLLQGTVVRDRELPPLTGLTGSLPTPPPTQSAAPPMPEAAAPATSPLLRNLLLALAGGVVLVGAVTFLLMRKPRAEG